MSETVVFACPECEWDIETDSAVQQAAGLLTCPDCDEILEAGEAQETTA